MLTLHTKIPPTTQWKPPSHAPNAVTTPDEQNKMSVRQLIDVQGYPVAKGGIIKKGFDCEAAVERCVAYLHGLSQLPGCPRCTGDRIKYCTCLQLPPINNTDILGEVQFMLNFRDMHFNTKKASYINFQKHASIVLQS